MRKFRPSQARNDVPMFNQRNDGGWCRCAECGATFGGLTGFDLHRRDVTRNPYDWRCATPAELGGLGMHQDGRGWWRQEARSTPYISTETPEQAFAVPKPPMQD